MKLKSIFPTGISGKFYLSNKIVGSKRDWIILMCVFLALIISVVVFDFVIYTKISSGEMYVSINRSELNLENLKTAELKKLIENFEAKTQKVTSLKIEPVIDPSI